MKKLTAIFLFTLFLFNIIGYRIVFFYACQQSDLLLQASLDENQYNESELVTIKVPLSLPYQTELSEFQRVDGEINFNGKIYKYVKRRIAEGSLILLCLPDYNKMRLKKEKDDFYKEANSLGQNQGSKKQENSKSPVKNMMSEYEHAPGNTVSIPFTQLSRHTYSNCDTRLSSTPHSSPSQPPELA